MAAYPAMDEVFKALADPSRRLLLDSLNERNGQTLRELCSGLDMARQSVSKHLAVLEAANLVTTVRRGREKLHYLNAAPDQRDRRPLDQPLRPGPRARARRPQTSTGGHDRGQALVRLHDLHQDHARAAVEGADRARLHRALLGHRPSTPTGRPGSPMTWHQRGVTIADPEQVVLESDPSAGCPTRGTRSRPSWPRRSDSTTTRARAPRGRAAVEGDLRHRAARRRAGQADRRPRRLRARQPACARWSATAGRGCWPTSRPCSRPASRCRTACRSAQGRRGAGAVVMTLSWAPMMAAMMLPSAAPAIARRARRARRAARRARVRGLVRRHVDAGRPRRLRALAAARRARRRAADRRAASTSSRRSSASAAGAAARTSGPGRGSASTASARASGSWRSSSRWAP